MGLLSHPRERRTAAVRDILGGADDPAGMALARSWDLITWSLDALAEIEPPGQQRRAARNLWRALIPERGARAAKFGAHAIVDLALRRTRPPAGALTEASHAAVKEALAAGFRLVPEDERQLARLASADEREQLTLISLPGRPVHHLASVALDGAAPGLAHGFLLLAKGEPRPRDEAELEELMDSIYREEDPEYAEAVDRAQALAATARATVETVVRMGLSEILTSYYAAIDPGVATALLKRTEPSPTGKRR